MCGISGFYDIEAKYLDESLGLVTKMSDQITHRGPDNQGIWLSDNKKLAFAHQRLSILDLSSEGNQPMHSSSGRYVIAFNGEIYNYVELKKILNLRQWRGTSDTEILLQVIEEKGLYEALKLIEGMFAFVLYDSFSNKLFLVRDRFGEKPLYYAIHNDTLLFASELKALKSHPAFINQTDKEAVSLYFKFGYIPMEKTIYHGVKKVLPSEVIELNLNLGNLQPKKSVYWNLPNSDEIEDGNSSHRNLMQTTLELETLLTDVISKEMISDVPLGSFLSGGIDSSLITGILQRLSSSKIDTFSIGYEEKAYNEAPYARKVASHLNTHHNELILTPTDLKILFQNYNLFFDQPFADPSAVPTFLVSQFAKSKLTVCLSGDGGDEFFGGYSRYKRTNDIFNKISKLPFLARKLLASSLYPFIQFTNRSKMERFIEYLKCETLVDCYKLQNQIPNTELKNSIKYLPDDLAIEYPKNLIDFEKILFSDIKTYLPDDILTKVDSTAMKVSLETRAPFLHHKVAEFAFNLPLNHKFNGAEGKIILKNLLLNYIPEELFQRPKMGFGIPIDKWIREDLRDWAGDLLTKENIESSGFLSSKPILKQFAEHSSGKKEWHYHLWRVLMFLEWQNHN